MAKPQERSPQKKALRSMIFRANIKASGTPAGARRETVWRALTPNLQNIPVTSDFGHVIRYGFVAPEGKMLVSADYSQVELRVLAHVSGDRVLAKAFLNN